MQLRVYAAERVIVRPNGFAFFLLYLLSRLRRAPVRRIDPRSRWCIFPAHVTNMPSEDSCRDDSFLATNLNAARDIWRLKSPA